MKKRELFVILGMLAVLSAITLIEKPSGSSEIGGVLTYNLTEVHAADPVPTSQWGYGNPTDPIRSSGQNAPTQGTQATTTPTNRATATPRPTATPTRRPSATPTHKPTATPRPTATPTPTLYVTPTPTPIPDAKLVSISAFYNGPSVLVGEDYKLSDITLYGYYDDDTMITITDFDVSDTLVSVTGQNKYVAIFGGMTDAFYVQGKVLNTVSALCDKFYVGFGNGLDSRDITVTAYYSDNSSEELEDGEYTISPTSFNKTGLQDVTVTYRDKSVKIQVYVNDRVDIKTLSISYSGDDLIVEQEVNRNDITVTAVYNDASFSTERITSYNLLHKSFTKIGKNTIRVEFMGKTAECNVTVKAKSVTALRAEYVGPDISVGTKFSKDDIKAYITYNDGKEYETTDFNVYNTVIRYLGDNTVKVYYGDYTASVVIRGCDMGEPDFDYVSEYSIKSGNLSLKITTAIPKVLPTSATVGSLVKRSKLKKVYRKLDTNTSDYMGFSFGFEDGDYEEYLPVTVRITLPEGYNAEYTELYYIPNLKSILAKMNKTQIDESTIEVTFFKTGNYMLVHDPAAYVETEDEPDEELN